MGIILKSKHEIELMRDAGKIVAEILQVLKYKVKSGMKTKELDEITRGELKKNKAQSSFLGYRGYPATLCVSVDFGAIYKGYQGDAAISVGIDEITSGARELLSVTENALKAGITSARKN